MMETINLPNNFEEFIIWDYEDDFKYEWFDGKIIQFGGINKHFLSIYFHLNQLFIKKNYWELGILISKQDIVIGNNQLRRPDIAYFTKQQV